MPLDWKSLADLPANDLQSRLLDEVDALMDGKSDTDEDRLLVELPEPLRAIWLISCMDFEVSQGSLLAYFFNSHGRHALLAIDLLQRMGARRMADVVAQAAASHERASAEWRARHEELDAVTDEYAVVKPYAVLSNAPDLDQLTDRYWQAAEVDDWGDKLDAYLSEQVRLLAG